MAFVTHLFYSFTSFIVHLLCSFIFFIPCPTYFFGSSITCLLMFSLTSLVYIHYDLSAVCIISALFTSYIPVFGNACTLADFYPHSSFLFIYLFIFILKVSIRTFIWSKELIILALYLPQPYHLLYPLLYYLNL